MRAARALEMLLILQRQGRTPARQLAEELEVSERTILRDVEVLSEAGVPILTHRGSHGGIELLDGFETNLTGLTRDEAQSLFLVGQPLLAHRLGLGAPSRSATGKLLAALPQALALEATTLSDRFLHDPDPWGGPDIPHGELRRIFRSIHGLRKIELSFPAEPEPRVVSPLALVLKAGSWNLVHAVSKGPEVMGLHRLQATRRTNRPFTRPENFDLSTFWQTHMREQPR